MDRKTYNECVGQGLRGKKFAPGERKREFCVLSKTCSGKASSREQATEMCEVSMSQPKAPRGRRAPRGRSSGGMRLVLLTNTGCKPCSSARAYLQKHIEKGLIEELDVQKSNEAADLVAKYGFGSVPKLLVLDDEGVPFSEVQVTDNQETI